MELTIILEPAEEGGFTVFVPALPGCISEGDTKEEAIKNIKKAIELYLESDTNELVDFSGEQLKLHV
jgi:predicted RNase H-like HicB family nuclease